MEGYRPESLEELQQLLGKLPEGAAFVAGGTDWVIRERKSTQRPPALVSLGSLSELRKVERCDGGLLVGAGCTMTQLEEESLLSGSWRAVAEAASQVGSTQIRNRGTIGGNIANASPAADLAAPLVCLQGEARLLGPEGAWSMPVEELLLGAERTALPERTVITGFFLPELEPGTVSHYHKQGFRRQLSIARFGVCLALKLSGDQVERARVAVGAIGPKAVRLPELEEVLVGRRLSGELGREAGAWLGGYIRRTSGRKYKAWASPGVMEDALGMFGTDQL